MKRILFITHNATKSGAPYVLYNFLTALKSNTDIRFDVLSLADGSMIRLFEKLTNVYLFKKKHGLAKKILNKIAKRTVNKKLEIFLKRSNYDTYYVNSVASLKGLPNLNFLKKKKSILHVHELDINIRQHNGDALLRQYINNFHQIICVSNLVMQNLVLNYNLDPNKARIINPLSRHITPEIILKKNLGLPKKSFVVGGCGYIELTKGIDIFLQVAKKVIFNEEKDRPIFFVWLGDKGNKNTINHINGDILKMNLQNKVIIIPSTDAPEKVFSNFNIFFLSSREDSFPLVAIENAKMGNPVLCFEKGTGFTEFVKNTNGIILPYLDIDKATEQILKLYNDQKLYQSLSENSIIDSRKFDNSKIYNEMLNVLNE